MSKKVVELRNHLRKLKTVHNGGTDTMTVAEARALSDEIAATSASYSLAIAEGAMPCPSCKTPAIGIEHQAGKRGFEYEVGCPHCPPFTHTDGTQRKVAARGGALPRHTVELWNEGPDYWIIATPQTTFAVAKIGRADDPPPNDPIMADD